MRPVSPKIAKPRFVPLAVTTGYFRDLAPKACPRFTAVAGLSDSLVVLVGTGRADRRQRLEPVGRQQR